jgi:hypothetical protein
MLQEVYTMHRNSAAIATLCQDAWRLDSDFGTRQFVDPNMAPYFVNKDARLCIRRRSGSIGHRKPFCIPTEKNFPEVLLSTCHAAVYLITKRLERHNLTAHRAEVFQ